jgi:lipoyl(octanoyl) transferase
LPKNWFIEEDFDRPGAHHMERDDTLARERVENPELPNVIRLYSWQPFGVSIGYRQRIESIDLDACQKAGVDVVRRPTGGRAVLHANELTYAVVMRADAKEGIYAAHNRIVTMLLEAIRNLGNEGSELEITARSNERNFRENYTEGTLTNVACFASSARHEVTWRGRKVIGSAQRRFGDVLLQHGSILLADDHLRLPDLLAISDQERIKMREMLLAETATLSDVFGRRIGIRECADAIRINWQK